MNPKALAQIAMTIEQLRRANPDLADNELVKQTKLALDDAIEADIQRQIERLRSTPPKAKK